ncbi:MAG TPA: diguanylate cyclase, partial [Sulfuricurvum sp.]|nr:diguanylate cyclase [Sulfuricurvum sp.]
LYFLLFGPLYQIVRQYRHIEARNKAQQIELLKFAHVIQQSADLVMITDKKGVAEYVNDAYPVITGYAKEEFIGASPSILNSGEHGKPFFADMWKTILSGNVFHGVIKNKRSNGELYYEEKTITPIRLEGDSITHFISTGKEITEKVLAEKALEESEYLFKTLAESSLTGIFMYQSTYTYVNKAFEEITGYDANELLELDTMELIHPEDREKVRARIEKKLTCVVDEVKHYDELRIVRQDGSCRWVYVTMVWIYYHGMLTGLGTMIDISERKKLERELEQLASTDKLTSLLNRTRFDDMAKREITYAQRYHTPLSVILFDVDHFKTVNDRYGHDAGDKVLVEIAKIGAETLRDSDIFLRWGGEEFLILLPQTTQEQACLLANRLREKIEKYPFECGTVTVSGGVAQYQNVELISDLIKRADIALYEAKSDGRNRIVRSDSN